MALSKFELSQGQLVWLSPDLTQEAAEWLLPAGFYRNAVGRPLLLLDGLSFTSRDCWVIPIRTCYDGFSVQSWGENSQILVLTCPVDDLRGPTGNIWMTKIYQQHKALCMQPGQAGQLRSTVYIPFKTVYCPLWYLDLTSVVEISVDILDKDKTLQYARTGLWGPGFDVVLNGVSRDVTRRMLTAVLGLDGIPISLINIKLPPLVLLDARSISEAPRDMLDECRLSSCICIVVWIELRDIPHVRICPIRDIAFDDIIGLPSFGLDQPPKDNYLMLDLERSRHSGQRINTMSVLVDFNSCVSVPWHTLRAIPASSIYNGFYVTDRCRQAEAFQFALERYELKLQEQLPTTPSPEQHVGQPSMTYPPGSEDPEMYD